MYAKLIASSVTAGIIAGGGAILASIAEGGTISQTAIIIAVVTGLVAAAKDLRTYIADSPTKKG